MGSNTKAGLHIFVDNCWVDLSPPDIHCLVFYEMQLIIGWRFNRENSQCLTVLAFFRLSSGHWNSEVSGGQLLNKKWNTQFIWTARFQERMRRWLCTPKGMQSWEMSLETCQLSQKQGWDQIRTCFLIFWSKQVSVPTFEETEGIEDHLEPDTWLYSA